MNLYLCLNWLRPRKSLSCLFTLVQWHINVRRISPVQLGWGIVLVVFLSRNIVNVTSTYTMAPLLYAYILLSKDRDLLPYSSRQIWAFKGSIVATIICLKTTYVPSIALLILLDFFLDSRALSQKLKSYMLWLLFFILIMLGWGYAHWEATGSAWYPFLGKGNICFEFPTYLIDGPGSFEERSYKIIQMVLGYPLIQLCLLASLFVFLFRPFQNNKYYFWLLIMPALSGSIILAKTGVFDFGAANHLLRYVSPFCQAVLVFCLINDGKLKLQIPMKDRRLQIWLLLFCYSLTC